MIPLFKVHMPESVREPLLKTLFSGYIGQGTQVDRFEDILSEWIGNKSILTLNNGTAAIHLALRLAGVDRGDEVISTPMTCTATNEPILERGAKIVWADINPKTGNIDSVDIIRRITSKTKAIMCVDFGGYPCNLDNINVMASKCGIKVIEDACHAFGTIYKDRKIGTISDYTIFSFQAIKHLTTVDGGALCCKSEEDHKRGKLLRWYGIDREVPKRDFRCEDDIKEYGYKFHMNDVCATIGIEQMKYIDGILAKHRENAVYYNHEFKVRNIKKCKPLEYLNCRLSSYWLYTILVDERDKFIEFMMGKKVQTSQVHARNDKHTMFKQFENRKLYGTDEFVAHQCSIPVGWWVGKEDRKYIMNCIKEFDNG